LANFLPPEKKYCLFLGAGFSKWAINLPTATELFDFQIKIGGPREGLKLRKIQELKEKWDKKNPSRNAEEFIGDLIDHSSELKKLVIWYVARRLTEPFIEKDRFFEYYSMIYPEITGRRVMTIDDKRKFTIDGIQKAKNFLNLMNGPNIQGIITTNYDLLIEYGLGTKNFYYGNRPRLLYGPRRGYYLTSFKKNPVYLRGPLPVTKLHGSISLTEKGYCTDGRGGITGKAIIVPPAQNKKIADILVPEWNCAKKILRASKKIIFFGFGFNQYDEEILSLLKDTEPWINEIILINKNFSLNIKAEQIWPSAKIRIFHPDDIQLPVIQKVIEKRWSPSKTYLHPPPPNNDHFTRILL
jgi:hypothetical protein